MRVPGREVSSQRVSVFLTLIDIRLLFNKAVTIHISASPERDALFVTSLPAADTAVLSQFSSVRWV